MKSYTTRDADEAFALHLQYQKALKENNFVVPDQAPTVIPPPLNKGTSIVIPASPLIPAPSPADTPIEITTEATPGIITQEEVQNEIPIAATDQNASILSSVAFLRAAAVKYASFLQDIDVPPQEKKKLTPAYIKDQVRYLKAFLQIVKKREGKISTFPVTSVTKVHVTDFYHWLEGRKLKLTSYNAHMKAVKYFFNWVIDKQKILMDNPCLDVKIREVHYDPEIIPVDELEHMFSFITEEHGKGTRGDKAKQVVNYYRPWLKKAIALMLLTGERLDGVVLLQWSHIDGNFMKIPNFKVQRIKQTEGKYYSYTPITADLAELLLQFDIKADSGYILEPDFKNRDTLKRFISAAFTHYWKVSGNTREVTIKNLRKTYETLLTDAIGERGMYVKHNDDKTAMKHYLDKKKLLEATRNVRLYDTSAWFDGQEGKPTGVKTRISRPKKSDKS